jgi:protein TIF31
VLLQINGAINSDVASCISKMANIQYKLGDYLQAIELQSKSLIIQEKLHGYDSPIVAYSYSNLGLYYHTCQYFSKGFEYMHKSLKILQVVCGDNHPDISAIYLNLGLMYQDVDNYNAAIDCYMDSLYRNIALYGDQHIQVASCYQAIAHAYYLL